MQHLLYWQEGLGYERNTLDIKKWEGNKSGDTASGNEGNLHDIKCQDV